MPLPKVMLWPPPRVPAGFGIDAGVGDIGLGREIGRRGIGAILLQQGLKSAGILRHCKNLRGDALAGSGMVGIILAYHPHLHLGAGQAL